MGNKQFNNSTCKGEKYGYDCDDCPYWERCDAQEVEEKEE